MKPPLIQWSNPNPEEWRVSIPGVGDYIVKKLRHFQWVAFFDERKTTFTGTNAEEVKVQVERAIKAFYMTKRRLP